MSGQLIDKMIDLIDDKTIDAAGGNKKCFLINDYALLKQSFVKDELEKAMQITDDLKEKGINVARTLDFKVLEQKVQDWGVDRDVTVSKGYVLQERAKGVPLLDRTNWNSENERYQLDYLNQIDSIAKENPEFFEQFVKGWLEIEKAGIGIDPSKAGNFMYEQGKGINFIDLDLSDIKNDVSTLIYEQLAVILNLSAYYQCYPEIQQAAQRRLSTILDKYKGAILEQGIDENILNQIVEEKLPEFVKDSEQQLEETPEQENSRLEDIINEHLIQKEGRNKIGKDDFKEVAESSIEEKSATFKSLKNAKEDLERDDNSIDQGELIW